MRRRLNIQIQVIHKMNEIQLPEHRNPQHLGLPLCEISPMRNPLTLLNNYKSMTKKCEHLKMTTTKITS